MTWNKHTHLKYYSKKNSKISLKRFKIASENLTPQWAEFQFCFHSVITNNSFP